MFKNPEYEYTGVAFKSDPKLKDSTVDIFSYTNRLTGKVNYSTERKAWGLYKSEIMTDLEHHYSQYIKNRLMATHRSIKYAKIILNYQSY